MADRADWNARYAEKPLVWSVGPNQRFAREIASLSAGKALDVACGEGRNAIYLAEQGWDVTAIDFSDVAIDKGRRMAEERGVKVDWINADVTDASLPRGRFDLVAVLYLHTDSESRREWLRRAVAAVAPGGTFIYIGHDPSNIEYGVGGPQDAQVLPEKEEICVYLEGFDIEFAGVTRRPVENDPGHSEQLDGVALDTVVRARKVG